MSSTANSVPSENISQEMDLCGDFYLLHSILLCVGPKYLVHNKYVCGCCHLLLLNIILVASHTGYFVLYLMTFPYCYWEYNVRGVGLGMRSKMSNHIRLYFHNKLAYIHSGSAFYLRHVRHYKLGFAILMQFWHVFTLEHNSQGFMVNNQLSVRARVWLSTINPMATVL